MNEIILQMAYYMVVMLLTFLCVNFFLRGFLLKFIGVKASLGRKILIKVRQVIYDDFAVGVITDGFLVFKYRKEMHRVPLPPDKKVFYRVLNTNWVDIDGEKWALSRCDYAPVSGYDPVKIQNFLKRILMQPQLTDTTLRTLLIIIIIIGIVLLGSIGFEFIIYQKVNALPQVISNACTDPTTITPAPI
jgi:hypothetical protein